MALEFFLSTSQGFLIGLDLLEAPAEFRRFLRGHAAMLVEFDWVFRHNHLPFAACAMPIPRSEATGERRKDEARSRRDASRSALTRRNMARFVHLRRKKPEHIFDHFAYN